jgi:hypothetical protein
MNLRDLAIKSFTFKSFTLIALGLFLLNGGCASALLGGRAEVTSPPRTTLLGKGEATVLPQIIFEVPPEKPLAKEVLKKGQTAPGDGLWFDEESAKIILGDLAEYRQLKVKVQIQEQIIKAYGDQAQLLREANDLQAQANQELRKEIESQRKWSTIKNWASVVGAVAAFALGIWAGK